MSRFLRFVVQETLDNGTDAVKEVTVAFAVFDRPADFNPKLDPVVRNEARRLRGKLDAYYSGEGSNDPVLISIPKGGYAPAFTALKQAVETEASVLEPVPSDSPIPAASVLPSAPAAAVALAPASTPVARPARKPALWLMIAVPIAALAALGFGMLNRNPAETSAAVTITPLTSEVGQDFDPAISPDGQQIAFVHEGPDGKLDIYVQPLSGEPRRLTTDPDNDLHPAWSPDGQSIAFLRATSETSRIIVMPATGGTEKQIVVPGRFDPGHQRVSAGPLDRLASPGPAWSPDGKSLVFRQCLPSRENGCPLHLVSLATLQVRQLTELIPGVADMCPAWSPDGRRIAFARFISSAVADLYTISAEGGSARRVTEEARGISGVTWSGDGRKLIFSSNRNGTYGLWAVSEEDRAIRAINVSGETAIEPAVLRDDHLLVYVDATTNVNIWRYDLESRTTEKLIGSTRHNNNAAWSPDGASVAFASDRSGSWELWLAHADGSHSVPLTKFGHGDIGRIQWAPDGRQIAFEARPEGVPQNFLIAPDGRQLRPLRPESSEQRVPTWSPDGRWLFYVSNRGGRLQIWKAPLNGGSPDLVCDCAASDVFPAPDGQSLFYYSPQEKGIREFVLSSGQARPVSGLEGVNPQRWWTVNASGIYFYDAAASQSGLFFYSFSSHQINRLTNLDRVLPVATPSLSISPDGKSLIFSRFDASHSKLMAIRGAFLDR
ncbi:MAG TPA: LpqB family beta-propeller domain-containing protein [Bryobacteraceae bacterium]|nr:LpqB family beta-propeller domain-containing protein [Bryobacteraceae bacterium]